jgi:hypothetical protein
MASRGFRYDDLELFCPRYQKKEFTILSLLTSLIMKVEASRLIQTRFVY